MKVSAYFSPVFPLKTKPVIGFTIFIAAHGVCEISICLKKWSRESINTAMKWVYLCFREYNILLVGIITKAVLQIVCDKLIIEDAISVTT